MVRKSKRRYVFPVVIEKDRNGYFAYCPSLQGCHTEADSFEDVLSNIHEVVQLHIEARLDRGESIPSNGNTSLTTVEVEV